MLFDYVNENSPSPIILLMTFVQKAETFQEENQW